MSNAGSGAAAGGSDAIPALSNEPIDNAVIAKLREDYDDKDGSLLAGLVESFTEETRVMQRVSQSEGEGEAFALSKAAHRLKSAAGTLGAQQVVALCVQIEQAERSGDKPRALRLVNQLMLAIVRARAVLKRIVTAAAAPTAG